MARVEILKFTALAITVDGDEPPAEFRLFAAGKVETSKGTFLFDSKAAKSVMAHYADQGNELMVDYDHASLGLALDPAQAGKAAGWFNLELRNGELWAVNVRWTEPATLALKRKEWRYMSPAFSTDEDGRILELINVALTNIPATKKLQPLMAAGQVRDRRQLSEGPSTSDLFRALQAAVEDLYPKGDDLPHPWVCDVYDATAVYEFDGKLFEVAYTFDGSVAALGKPAEVQRKYTPVAASKPKRRATVTLAKLGGSMSPDLVKKVLEALESGDTDAMKTVLQAIVAEAAGAGGDPAPEGAPAEMAEGEDEDPPPDQLAEDEDEDAPAAMAATARLLRLTGKDTFAGALDEVETWRQSHIKLSSEREKLAKERAAMEAIDRRKLVAELVKLGNEIPATAWKDPQAKNLVPCKRLQDEPLAELRDRVAKLTAARGSKGQRVPQPPPSSTDAEGGQEFQTAHGAFTLSASALAECKRKNLDPAVLAETRAAIAARSNHARTEA